MKETNWINVCKVGTWTAKNGNQVELTNVDFDAIVAAYNPTDREAPLVFGHPEDNAPAYGWATRFRRLGDFLQARFKQVPESVRQLVDAGHYKHVSLSLMPDKKTVRHVGLLGAAQPAVPGLGSVQFSDGDDGYLVIEFTAAKDPHNKGRMDMEVEELKQKLEEAKQETQRLQTDLSAANSKAEEATSKLAEMADGQHRKEIETRVDDLVGKQITAAEKPAIMAVALSLGKSEDEIELSSGAGKKPLADHLFDFLQGLPDRQLLDEFSAPSGDEKNETIDVDLTACV